MNKFAVICRCMLLTVIVVVFIAGCSTITITPDGTQKLSTSPAYEERKNYFLWGLVGEHHIDAKNVCGVKKIEQMQAQDTFVDALLGTVTLGIYAPRTAKIWCGEK